MKHAPVVVAAIASAALGAGAVSALHKAPPPPSADIPVVAHLEGEEAAAVLLDDAGEPRKFANGATVRCEPGGFLDGAWRDDVEWCSDGAGQMWQRPARGPETITLTDGMVLSTKHPKAEPQK